MREIHAPLVSCETLFEHIKDPDWVVFDCRHDLTDAKWGRREYGKRHIPGAVHAHIDDDLSGPVGTGGKGRHPLPIPGAFLRFLRQSGVKNSSQVVVYDDQGGVWAARLWWLLRHYGHEAVAVLDGGWQRWRELHLPVQTDHSRVPDGDFDGKPGGMPIVDLPDVEAGQRMMDARAAERYTGQTEPIDPVAGHIPGAINHPFTKNLAVNGLFLSPDELKAHYEGHRDRAVYCGSGVTACHNILAAEVGGIGPLALYPGSWSQWCRDGRPVATGEEPGNLVVETATEEE